MSATAGVFALALTSSAFAAYNPLLIVTGNNHALGGSGPVVIGVGQNENDDATGVVTLYSPLGYGVTLTQPAGTTLGSLSGVVKVGALGGARVNIEGTVKTDNPVNHVSNPCSPGTHEAVWILEFMLGGTTLRLPMYVDRVTTAPESAFASARMRVCLASPYVPPPQGAQSGASLIIAAFTVKGVFTNPGTRGSYPWNGLFVPYTPGTATLNPSNAAQSTSTIRLPVQLAVKAKRQKRGKRTFALVTACLTEAGSGVRGVRVDILGGLTVRRARRVARGRTNARGCTTVRVRVRTKVMFFVAATSIPERQASACTPPIPVATGAPPARCSQPSFAPAFNLISRNSARVRR